MLLALPVFGLKLGSSGFCVFFFFSFTILDLYVKPVKINPDLSLNLVCDWVLSCRFLSYGWIVSLFDVLKLDYHNLAMFELLYTGLCVVRFKGVKTLRTRLSLIIVRQLVN